MLLICLLVLLTYVLVSSCSLVSFSLKIGSYMRVGFVMYFILFCIKLHCCGDAVSDFCEGLYWFVVAQASLGIAPHSSLWTEIRESPELISWSPEEAWAALQVLKRCSHIHLTPRIPRWKLMNCTKQYERTASDELNWRVTWKMEGRKKEMTCSTCQEEASVCSCAALCPLSLSCFLCETGAERPDPGMPRSEQRSGPPDHQRDPNSPQL